MGKLRLDLHDMYDKGDEIENALKEFFREAVEKRMTPLEIIPGKGSGALKKRVARFLQRPEIKSLYSRIENDDKNHGRLFVHFKFKSMER